MNKKSFVRALALLTCLIITAALAILSLVFKQNVILSGIITAIFALVLLVIFFSLDTFEKDSIQAVEKNLDTASRNGLAIGNIGILTYTNDYEINWMSSFFEKHNLDYVGDKLLNWLPDLQDVLNGEVDKKIVIINDNKYEINRLNNNSVLIFKDITEVYDLNKQLNDNACVIGLVGFDNMDESLINEEDSTFISINIKMPVIDYFKKYNCVYKTLKNNRLLLVMNERIFKQIYDDRFSILTKVRKIAGDGNLDVTLSMAFARGSQDLTELDETAEQLLELAQTRGGDQVVVRKIGEDASFFGGSSEAREKRNKAKLRVTITALKDQINKCDNVIIVGHKDADADCIGSAICMSDIVLSMNKPVYILSKSGGIESMINDVLNKYNAELVKKHQFIDEDKAIQLLNENTLVIMVDHHSILQSNGAQLLKMTNNIVIIDHHRRKADLDVSPIMLYVEASASSTCEMVCEFLPYMSRNLQVSECEANIMYIGLLIDTDRFRVRTGARTFDVLKQLKRYGADSQECDELSQEPYNNVISRSHIINAGKKYRNDVIIASLNDDIYSRSIASQACDTMVKAKGIEAAFVICSTSSEDVIITARSKGKINVQVIMEKMQGGGHMSAAGLQRKGVAVDSLEKELRETLQEYFKEVDINESNIA